MTLKFDLTHDLGLGLSRSHFEIALSQEGWTHYVTLNFDLDCEFSWSNLKLSISQESLQILLECMAKHLYPSYTVECRRYNAVQFITILHRILQWQQQNIYHISNSQQTPHTSPSRASYGVSIMIILKKIDRVITASHCIVHLYMALVGTLEVTLEMLAFLPWHSIFVWSSDLQTTNWIDFKGGGMGYEVIVMGTISVGERPPQRQLWME